MTVAQTVSDRKGGGRVEAGRGFVVTYSGRGAADLSGQVGLGFGRLCWWFWSEG